MFGKDAVERVGLFSSELREALGSAAHAGEAEDGLGQSQKAGVERDSVGEVGFAFAAEDAAAGGGEGDAFVGFGGGAATGADEEFGEVAAFFEEVEFPGQHAFFAFFGGEFGKRSDEAVK